jgi:hypothetical protein
MSAKYFRYENLLVMFDPGTYKIFAYAGDNWVETDDPELRHRIRFSSVEMTRDQAANWVAQRRMNC